MHPILQVSKYTAIKQLLCSKLLHALSIYAGRVNKESIKAEKIPLYKGRNSNRAFYLSGLALALTVSHNSPIDIANDLVSLLSVNCSPDIKLRVVEGGWIDLEIAEAFIATWLQSLFSSGGEKGNVTTSQELGVKSQELGVKSQELGVNNQELGVKSQELGVKNSSSLIPPSSSLFAVQYAHARCCSLIRLAMGQDLIWVRGVDTKSIEPNPLPWLNSEGKLRFCEDGELHLLSELIQIVDDLRFPLFDGGVDNLAKWEKTALSLSRTFDKFWSQCPMIKIPDSELARARIGLVIITQSILKFLLSEKFGLEVMEEL